MLNYFNLDYLKVTSILYKEHKESPERIRIKLDDLIVNSNRKKAQLNSVIQLVFPGDEISEISFSSQFSLSDSELIQALKSRNKEKASEAVALLFTYIYPFIRENVWTILKDTRNPVRLPMIDCRWLDLNDGVELRRNKE